MAMPRCLLLKRSEKLYPSELMWKLSNILHCADTSQRASAHEARKEAADENGLGILADSYGNIEDRKSKRADDEGHLSPVQLRKRRPQDGSHCEAEHVKGHTKYADLARDVELGSDGSGG